MKNKYLIRLDDACPTMIHHHWTRVFAILDQYGVKPMVGIIPHNEDPKQNIDAPDAEFWSKAQEWEKKGYAIALHGYNHVYISNEAGINPLWHRSEFAGVSLEMQKQKIHDGYAILKAHGLTPRYFFAPSHTFDENTLVALRECSDIRIISDTIATKPYRKYGFTFIPQLGGHCVEMKIPGIWTFCLHPSMMNDDAFEALKLFLSKHKDEFISFDDLNLDQLKGKDMLSRFLAWIYFTKRKIKGIQ